MENPIVPSEAATVDIAPPALPPNISELAAGGAEELGTEGDLLIEEIAIDSICGIY